MSWQLGVLSLLALVLIGGGVWFERSRPSARILAAVAALAALGVAGRLVLAPLPNVVGTTDVALLAGYTLGGPAGFAVGALSALVSNFWLGQGPWTPWQMAGWGAVGIGGAALATLSGRSLGRAGLAIAAALAGLFYGALLDLSTMVNFGGEQSLDRYLALSARGIPFNIAHAAGNAAIMVAVGPALVRMLERYRERFDVHWRQLPRPGPAVAAPLLAALLALALVALPTRPADAADDPVAAAGAGSGASAAGAADGRRWLAGSQNRDGGWGTAAGGRSSPGMTGWAMLGLEAAGRNPLDLRRGDRSAVGYLRRNVDQLTSTGDLERTILALRGAGLRADRFGGRNLVAELRSRQDGRGSYEGQVNLSAFAILARSAAGEGGGSLRRAAGWLESAQNGDGGWGSVKGAESEPDSTGAALQALAVLGGRRARLAGADWLRRAQGADGGWSLTAGGGSNSQSTAWALQGLIAAGVAPDRVRNGGRSGFQYLSARQARDGHYGYSKASDQTPTWVTAQALTAVAREPFPIAPVAQADAPRRRGGSASGSPDSEGAGSGGSQSASGSGRPAGGGRRSGADASPRNRARGRAGSGSKSGRSNSAGSAAGLRAAAASSAGTGVLGEPTEAATATGAEQRSKAPLAALLVAGVVAAAGLGGRLAWRRDSVSRARQWRPWT